MDQNTVLINLTIDENLRTIAIPTNGVVFGVVGDIEVNRVMFVLPRYFRGFDLTEFIARVNYANPNGDANYYEADDISDTDGNCTFTWLMGSDVTAYVGDVTFSITLYKKDGDKVIHRFNTKAATARVLDGFSVDTSVTPAQQKTLVEKISEEVINNFKTDETVAQIERNSKVLQLINISDNLSYSTGYYINSDSGNTMPLNGFKSCDYIDVSLLSKVYIRKTFYYGKDSLCFYNSGKKVLSSYADTSPGYVYLQVPDGAKYLRMSCKENESLYILGVVDALKTNNAINTLITQHDYVSDVITRRELSNINNIKASNQYVVIDIKNGIIEHSHTGDGNNYFHMAVTNYNKQYNNIKFVADVNLIKGNARFYIFGTKTDNSNLIYSLDKILKSGTYTRDIDLNYMAVYRDLDLSKPITVGIANDTEDYQATYSNLHIYDNDLLLTPGITLKENLNRMILSIEKNSSDISILSKNNTESIVSPNGTKFALSISDDGNIITTRIIPSNILYIGNSLLLGFGTFGMAATRSSEDYYHLVNKYVTDLGGELKTSRIQGVGYENCTSSEKQEQWLNTTLLPSLNNDIDLVIIQLGDNVNTDDKLAVFNTGAEKIISFIRSNAQKARVAWVGEWYSSSTKQQYIINACIKYGATFIDISDLSIKENQNMVGGVYYSEDGTEHIIENSGVASHPSSQGMKQIAQRIIDTLF